MEIEIFIHSEDCEHCAPTLRFLSAVVGTLKSGLVKLKVHQLSKNKEAATKLKITANQVPVIILPSGCKITGSLSHDLIGTLACSLISQSNIPIQSVEKFELTKKDAPTLIMLTSAMIEYQAAYTQRRDRAYNFIIKESTKDIPVERYKQLALNTKILLLTNFDTHPSPQLYEWGLEDNVFLGHIIRDNMCFSGNLIVWRERANHITFFKLKHKESGDYEGTCSSLLAEGKKMMKEFFKPLFLTSSTINVDGNKGEGQNRIVATVKDVSNDLEYLLKK